MLFSSGIRPIGKCNLCCSYAYTFSLTFVQLQVLIAFTNHALDHMLTSVLDAPITNKVVRLGSRSSDERISKYTLNELEKLSNATSKNRAMGRAFAIMKQLEERLTNVMASIRSPRLSWGQISEYLDVHYPDHADSIRSPPFWVSNLANMMWAEEDDGGAFETQKKGKKKALVDDSVARTLYGFWKSAGDIHFVAQPHNQLTDVNADGQAPSLQALLASPRAFFDNLGFNGLTPPVPATNRSVQELLLSGRVWAMSASERQRLSGDWEQKIRSHAFDSQFHEYTRLREEYQEACRDLEDIKDEVRDPSVCHGDGKY